MDALAKMTGRGQRQLKLAHYREGLSLGLVPPELVCPPRGKTAKLYAAVEVYWLSSCAVDPNFERRLVGNLIT